jgi:predicted site-specific integrase-resolvase
MRSYSVKQTARLVRIDPQTLFRWIWQGKVRPSIVVPMDERKVYRFTDEDIKRLRRHKAEHYWEGRGGRRKKRGRK